MKKWTYYNRCLFLLFSCLFLGACSSDGGNDVIDDVKKTGQDTRDGTLAWIEDTMRDHYYWYGEMPDHPDYNQKPDDFFYSLLSSKDGRKLVRVDGSSMTLLFSQIEQTAATKGFIEDNYSYGFEFETYSLGNKVGALILYVLPNSPAYGKLKRGDWIMQVDGKYITTNEAVQNLSGDGAKTFTLARYDEATGQFVLTGDVKIESAREVEDDPVFLSKVLQAGGKKVGYLVYNGFEDGKSDGDETYNNELRSLSGQLFNGVDEFVLDLRYNPGGTLSSALLLCAILAPEAALNQQLFGYMRYNDKQPQQEAYFSLNKKLDSGGKNLNLKTLYVLTGTYTASASEALINLLKPYMNVVIIGERTVGKNVGSEAYANGDKSWTMHPIVCQIYNSEDFSDYADGFEPDYTVHDTYTSASINRFNLVDPLPLGDPNERLLSVALELISGTYTGMSMRSAVSGISCQPGPVRSLDRKALGSVIIK